MVDVICVPLNLVLLLTAIDVAAIWYSFTNEDKSYYTDIITSFMSGILSGLLAIQYIGGITAAIVVVGTSAECETYHSVHYGILFGIMAVIMIIFGIVKVLELGHSEVEKL